MREGSRAGNLQAVGWLNRSLDGLGYASTLPVIGFPGLSRTTRPDSRPSRSVTNSLFVLDSFGRNLTGVHYDLSSRPVIRIPL